MALTSGSRFGAYEIVAAIGAGGMGEVYRASDTRLKRDVAIKVLPDTLAQDPDRVARFQREAELLASLNHPNIAQIYGLERQEGQGGPEGPTSFIVMELVEGDTLADVIARGRCAVDDTLPIARQIADALEAAHDKGVVHRDLKPANIKITPDGRVKVLDFGLAKMLQDGTGLPAEARSAKAGGLTMSPTLSVHATYAGIILGTAAYMSPEQARGKPVDRRTDVWAFGCVVYEMLTGRHSFEPGETVSDAIVSVLSREPDWGALPADTPAPIRRLLRRCLQKDVQTRLPHIGAARIEIDEAHAGVSDDAAGAASAAAAADQHRGRWNRVSLVAVAAALIVGALAAGYGAWRLKPDPPRAMTRFPLLLPEGQTFTNPGRQLLALSPDGTNLVYVANLRLFVRSMAGFEAHPIAGSEAGGGGITSPAFSPDGQSVAFFATGDRTLKRIATSGGAPITICAAENPLGMSWSEDGIVFGQQGKGILRVSPDGGTPKVIVPVGDDQIMASPQMLPGGTAALFTIKKTADAWDNGQIVAQTLDKNARKILVERGSDGRYLPTGHLVYALSGVLLAVPFDPSRLQVSGGPVPVVEGVRKVPGSVQVSGGMTAQFSYAANGTLAYLPGPATLGTFGQADLAVFAVNGGMQPLKLPPGSYSSPRVSPDGKTIAFDSEDEKDAVVWVYDLAGTSTMRRLTFGGKNRWPVWSPDSQWIAFQSDREGDLAIFRQRADGSSGTAERLTKPDAGANHSPLSWSPDGAHLLVAVQKDRLSALWTLALNDRHMTPFGNVDSVSQIDATFSPDGRWVAYHARSVNDPTNHTLLQPFPATGSKYLVAEAGGHPYWLGKTNRLILNIGAYRSAAIAVTTTPRVAFGQPVDISRQNRIEGPASTTRRNADAMPDGEHLIGVTISANDSGSGAPTQINFVLNWLDEVRRKVPVK